MDRNLIFSGRLREGARLEQVRANFARLFQLREEQLNVLFSGKPIVLKKKLSEERARKYVALLFKAGAYCDFDPPLKPLPAAAPRPAPRPEPAPLPAAPPSAVIDPFASLDLPSTPAEEVSAPAPMTLSLTAMPVLVEEKRPAPAPAATANAGELDLKI